MAVWLERMVRIIAGSARGLKIKTVSSDKTKPTLDRVKESMFSILTGEVEGRMVLDLFSGNGSLGLEALSRGAAFVCMNDYDKACRGVILENLTHTGFTERAAVSQLDYKEALALYQKQGRQFGLILLDPPYGAHLIPQVLELVSNRSLYTPGCVVMCEHTKEDTWPEQVGVFVKQKTRSYGTVGLTVYQVEE
ncbi:MAG: 16S rRNA (guanine(966)-N(2))-methyltransferase RsmD [Clostridia bacterium]|nr:16S rRNA (guanine(966)-N(2))-methyltransferase RsmD [Clostridia bacterium]